MPTEIVAAQTKAYLWAFQEELAKASAALKSAMEVRFPDLAMGMALDIGARSPPTR
ncbi:hypothetical protein NX862_17615 [Rhodobacter sp. KR11]|uniref:hypothetical protein n=1 Tax=Rhodobacter sp. KR11 TaxID=2974588 RepID=UPI002222A3B8|nr:hypothetical protein [Rhodobacter sp. KR11]MCW1920579.1 hypothetical protein [Rhodobacter sp. KR11]